ncbi:hypothetical protein CRENBAI_006333 [Crenichthys baileyi]|uniref:Uncharacterized protein n=1 Tax=Crenichthys baileyi TaxID=28760 RepID=A0AAV9QXE8_9TELE
MCDIPAAPDWLGYDPEAALQQAGSDPEEKELASEESDFPHQVFAFELLSGWLPPASLPATTTQARGTSQRT